MNARQSTNCAEHLCVPVCLRAYSADRSRHGKPRRCVKPHTHTHPRCCFPHVQANMPPFRKQAPARKGDQNLAQHLGAKRRTLTVGVRPWAPGIRAGNRTPKRIEKSSTYLMWPAHNETTHRYSSGGHEKGRQTQTSMRKIVLNGRAFFAHVWTCITQATSPRLFPEELL